MITTFEVLLRGLSAKEIVDRYKEIYQDKGFLILDELIYKRYKRDINVNIGESISFKDIYFFKVIDKYVCIDRAEKWYEIEEDF